MKSKVTKIHPDGATVTRADGSAVNVGDEVDGVGELTLTIPMGAMGGSIAVDRLPALGLRIRERQAVRPALAIGDAAAPSRASAPVGRVSRTTPLVLKIE